MKDISRNHTWLWLALAVGTASLVGGAAPPPLLLADHGDTPLLISVARHDARITDLFVFERGGTLVLAVCTDPTVAPAATQYVFPSDLEIRILVDNDSEVIFDDPNDLATFGGTIVRPHDVNQDIKFMINFDKNGQPKLRTSGLPRRAQNNIRLFTGLRDDPFIRGPRIGRNVAAVVIELPLQDVLDGSDTLLVWATARVPNIGGPFQELAGRALRNQFPENDVLNVAHPKFHTRLLGGPPDVVIYNTSLSPAFPNGRELADDVVDLVGDPRPLANDDPFPSMNDVPFLSVFPYLAPPQ